MAQKAVKPRGGSRPIIEPKKVVELGVYVTAGQLQRLERILGNWSIKYAVLPQCEPPYQDLAEWVEECTEPHISGNSDVIKAGIHNAKLSANA